LTVNVTDVNDNAPKFVRSLYETSVDEARAPGQYIIQVAAQDADIGQNAEIVYSLEERARGYLSIQPHSGVITTKVPLDREANQTLRFKVIATDNGIEPQTGHTSLVITLRDINDNSPVFRRSKFSYLISEKTANGTFVGQIEASDRDAGANGQIDYYFGGSSGGDTPLPIKVLKNGSLIVSGELDREKKDSYSFTVLARDRGGVPKSSAAGVALTVNVTDVNDNAPKFVRSLYETSVDEARAPGQYIIQVAAQDADIGQNAEIVYSLEERARGYLSIQPHSGVITTKVPLDREANQTLRFKVIATDNGIEPQTGHTSLVITLRDVNDNSPVFRRSKFSYLISEKTANGTFVGQIEASDRDAGANGQIDYYFGGSSGGDTPLPIKVLKNGSLIVSGELDREKKDSYSFTVLARDRGGVPKSSAAGVEVKILDENDNDPVIIFPSTNNHSIVISNFPEQGMVLARIIAYDEDEGGAQPLKFSIFGGNEDDAFSIDSTKGELVVRDISRLQNPHDYILSIKVEDATTQPRNATTQLKIEVNFENKTEWYGSRGGRGHGQAGENGNDESKDGRREQYVVIVGVIGGVTLVLSIIIITAIIFILRSEKKRHSETNSTMGSNDSFFKNKFFKSSGSTSGGAGGNTGSGSVSTGQTVVPHVQKPAGDGGGGKFQGSTSSFTGSGDSGFVMGPGGGGNGLGELGKKQSQHLQQAQKPPQDDVLLQKKVSFSPDVKKHEGDDDDGEDTESEETNNLQSHGQGRATPDKQLLRLNLPPTAEANLVWPPFNNPDDLHSDTSGESGTCDSGRGTSDEDIKFDPPPPAELSDPYMVMSARPNFQYQDQLINKPLNIMSANMNNLNTFSSKSSLAPLAAPSTAEMSAPSIHIPPHLPYPHSHQQKQHPLNPLIKPGQPRFLEMGSGRYANNTNSYGTGPARRSYHGPRQMQLSSSSSSSSPLCSPSGGMAKSLLSPSSSSSRQHHQQQQQNPQQQRLLFKNSNSSNSISQDLLRRPGSSLSFTQQGSVMSMDDDASTTTSGSYVINPEDIRLEGMMGKDIIV
ncbi:hypothetical protein EGW08_001415, partial [Elysia chlorotica]